MENHNSLLSKIRFCLGIFMLGLVLSGLSAFPLRTELPIVMNVLTHLGISAQSEVILWLAKVDQVLESTGRQYPFLAYGTDWLGFAHIVIAAAFIGAWRDPVRNKWLFVFGLFNCAAVVPFAIIAGGARDIPFFWRLVDSSFGILGAIPLWLSLRYVNQMEQSSAK
jgi:hypothetical protein